MMCYSFVSSAPRWAKLPTFLRNQAWALHLELTLEVEKHWLSETIRGRVTGNQADIERFMEIYNKSVDAYNEVKS